jgi:hypothetical protein
MTDAKRMPTEMEVRALLHNAASRMEDEETIGRYASRSGLVVRGRIELLVVTIVIVAGANLLPLLERSVQSAVWWVLACLIGLVVAQSVEIGRLTKVAAALARTAERVRHAEPLPRAPSPES